MTMWLLVFVVIMGNSAVVTKSSDFFDTEENCKKSGTEAIKGLKEEDVVAFRCVPLTRQQ